MQELWTTPLAQTLSIAVAAAFFIRRLRENNEPLLFPKSRKSLKKSFKRSRYGYYVSDGKSLVKAHNSNRHVVASLDLDGTVVGIVPEDDESTREFNQAWCEGHTNNDSSVLIYNSGRGMSAYVALLEQCAERGLALLRPDYYIAAEGSDIFEFRDNKVEPTINKEWHAHLREEWDIEEVRGIVRGLAKGNKHVRNFPTGASSGEPFRESLVMQGEENVIKFAEVLKKAFAAKGVRSSALIFHCGGVIEKGTYIKDRFWCSCVPARAGKGKALDFVRRKLKVDASHLFAAGDSGNDIPAIGVESVVNNSVAVANSHKELVEYVDKENPQRKHKILLAKTNAAKGICEGLRHFGFLG